MLAARAARSMCGGVAALGSGVSLVVEACGDVNNGWALSLGHGRWSIDRWKVLRCLVCSFCTMVFAVEEERKHPCAYFPLPHRGCPL